MGESSAGFPVSGARFLDKLFEKSALKTFSCYPNFVAPTILGTTLAD